MSSHDRNLEDSPLTPRFIIKAGAAAFVLISGIVSIVLYISTLKSDIASLRDAIQSARHETDGRLVEDERQIDRLRNHSEQTDRTVEDVQRKLEVSITILTRIDKKVNGN